MITVFDFDGTLSYKDSMKSLFDEQMTGIRSVYRIYYYVLKVLAKLKITTVKFEKEQMLKLLFRSEVSRFASASREQAGRFQLNPVFAKVQEHIDRADRVIVLSASSEYFLNVIFKDMNVEIIGTTLRLNGNRILGIDRHPFYHEKVERLKEIGITEVDEMYYDSKWDEVLIPMCKEAHKVINGQII